MNPMGEMQDRPFQLPFNASLKIRFPRFQCHLRRRLGPGNVHSAESWEEVLLPEIERQQEMGKEAAFRADATFARPDVYEALEARGVKYAIRMPANDGLERDIAELLPRPV